MKPRRYINVGRVRTMFVSFAVGGIVGLYTDWKILVASLVSAIIVYWLIGTEE